MTNGKENAAHANRCRWEQKRQKLVLSQEPKGTAQTKRGYRGQRIGEARHPGPSGLVAALFCIMAQDRVSGRRYEVQFLASGRLSELLRGLSGMGMWNVEPAPGQRHVTVFSCLECANQIFGKKNCGFQLRNKTCLSKFAGGTALTRRGYRGQRIGEASHPGPQAPSCAPDERLGLGTDEFGPASGQRMQVKSDENDFEECASQPASGQRSIPLKIWSTNVSSWNKHGEALLDFADREEVLVVRAQEANLASDEIGTAMWNARRQGWQTLFVPPFGNNRGGLAVAVKEPLAVSQVNSLSTNDGQNLQVEVHGLQRPFRLFNIYQRPKCWNPEVFNPMAGLQQFWVCCGDFNFPVKDMHLGLLTGTGRHASSSQPIDAIWVSPKFSSSFDGGEIESFGNDHSIAWATLSVPHLVSPRLQDHRTLWKFRRHRKIHGVGPSPDAASAIWQSVASPLSVWQQALVSSAEDLWAVWTQDFEAFLAQTGQIRPTGRRCLIGAVPSLVSAGHHLAPGQCHKERELRRCIRRAREALFLSRKGATIPTGLVTNLRKSVPSRNRGLVDGKRWGSLEADLCGQLDEFHFAKTKLKKDAWKADMQDLSKASAWVKQSQPPPFLLQKEDGTVVAGQAAGLQALFPFWAKVFGREDVSDDPVNFWRNMLRSCRR